MMLSCKEATRLASDALDQTMPLGRRLALKLHLLLCPPCNRFAAQIARLERLYRQHRENSSEGATLSPATKERIKERLTPRE